MQKDQLRLVFPTAIIATFLTYVSNRSFFQNWTSDSEIILLLALGSAAFCSVMYLILFAAELKYHANARSMVGFLGIRPDDKEVFFDLSVDVFTLMPFLFLTFSMSSGLSSYFPDNSALTILLGGLLSTFLLISLKPVWRGLMWVLSSSGRPSHLNSREGAKEFLLTVVLGLLLFVMHLKIYASESSAVAVVFKVLLGAVLLAALLIAAIRYRRA